MVRSTDNKRCSNKRCSNRRIKARCAQRCKMRTRLNRIVDLERLERRDLLSGDVISTVPQPEHSWGAGVCEVDRWQVDVALVSPADAGVEVGDNAACAARADACRGPGFHRCGTGLRVLPRLPQMLSPIETVVGGDGSDWCPHMPGLESIFGDCEDLGLAVENLESPLQVISRVEPISIAHWFAPSLATWDEPLVPVPLDDWTAALSLFSADLQIWELPDELLQQVSLGENLKYFTCYDPRIAGEFVQLFFQQAEQVLQQPGVQLWLNGDWIPWWLQAGVLAGSTAAIGSTVWCGYPEWGDPTAMNSFDALAAACAESLSGQRVGLPTMLQGAAETPLGWQLRGEYWPFGTDVIDEQNDAAAAIGFSGRVWYLSELQHVQWTSDIALGFDRTGMQAGYLDLVGSFVESPARVDLVVAGSYGDGPGLDDGTGQLSLGLSGSGKLPLTAGGRRELLRFAVGVEYACEFDSRCDRRAELTVCGSLRWEY